MKILVLKIVIMIIGVLLIINTVILAALTNFNSGIIFSAIIAVVLILSGLYIEQILKIKWLIYSSGIVCGCLLYLAAFIAVYGTIDNVTYAEDAVVVLGAGIKGEQVTKLLSYRLDKAVEYYNKNTDALIIVSGGQGFQESITEALAMERYLLSKGIPQDKIVKEENSTSTYTNFIYSKEILDAYFDKLYKTAIITNDFHIYRATRIAKSVGLDCSHYHAKIEWYAIPMNYFRECAAVIKTWIIGK